MSVLNTQEQYEKIQFLSSLLYNVKYRNFEMTIFLILKSSIKMLVTFKRLLFIWFL